MLQLSADSDVEIKEENTRPGKNISRIFFGMGRRDNIKVFELTELLTSKTNLTNADINKIDMHDNFTFFEIPTKFIDELVFAFSTPYNGRRVLVEEAKAKGEGDRSRSRSDVLGSPKRDKPRFLTDKPSRSGSRDRRPARNDDRNNRSDRNDRSFDRNDKSFDRGERKERTFDRGERKEKSFDRSERKDRRY